ncbi:NHL repeat-containing protein [Mucilaginibacter psychrotolerans]|uniref:SMP-30/Gluconolactonase/LRE-like region domain-containing protein n=1 Tax=Mucilaginibacter psychrotolerans TaxID=1524096 RepID=A0A4Y8SD71_9SPHI|nr:hypothetical protein [Mucilaginibacter psychrotolerans]TFF36306.1 hypothetical protein E2R66_15835 [Mucilaginibacter psychrotolerans]
MKKALYLLMGAVLVSVYSCKRDDQLKPVPDTEMAASKAQESLAINAVPLLIAGKKNTPGFTNGTGGAARFNTPSGIFVDGDGVLYVCDFSNSAVRKISTQNKVTTLNIDPDLFGSVEVSGGPQNVAVLNNGVVGVQSSNNILLYQNGAVFKNFDHFTDFSYGNFGGIDEGYDGTFFNFITNYVDLPNEVYNSKLGVIKNNAYLGGLTVISNDSNANNLEANSATTKYVVINARLNKLTSAGATVVYSNLIPSATVYDVAVSKAGTEIYVIDSGNIKRIKNNAILTIISGVKASSIALANSERYIYYTSADEQTVSRIALP